MEIPAIIHPKVNSFLEKGNSKIFELVQAFGSALHIIFPALVADNIREYQSVMTDAEIKGSILYAAKANKSQAILEVISKCGIGIDVSSLYELRQALSHGIDGRNIGISGSTKDSRLILLALQNYCVIAIDSLHDLNNLIQIKRYSGVKQKGNILLRINDVSPQKSRFGIGRNELPEFYSLLNSVAGEVDFRGFSFHLDGYSIEERTKAIIDLCREIEIARKNGFNCNTIDIGGGFTISYVNYDSWYKFNQALAADEVRFWSDKKIKRYYPYHNDNPKQLFLKKILESQVSTHQSVANLLRSKCINLFIEPGRSLLDQVGITLVRVKDVKTFANGENMVIVEANVNNLSEQWFNSDYLPDPILLSTDSLPQNFEAPIGGNTCLEVDMLTWRKIGFPSRPKTGDILLYINTAGYQMDSNESEFHQLPLSEKIAVYCRDGQWQWKQDKLFSQLDI